MDIYSHVKTNGEKFTIKSLKKILSGIFFGVVINANPRSSLHLHDEHMVENLNLHPYVYDSKECSYLIL